MRKEAAKRDVLTKIEEKVGPPRIMALKGEAKNTEEAIQTEEKRSNRPNTIQLNCISSQNGESYCTDSPFLLTKTPIFLACGLTEIVKLQ